MADLNAIRKVTHIDNVKLNKEENAVVIIDQTELPNRLVYLTMDKPKEMYDAIKKLQIRGAPAIGIMAGYSMYVLANQHRDVAYPFFAQKMKDYGAYLNSSRPTAVNLGWAIKRMLDIVEKGEGTPVEEIVRKMKEEAKAIHMEDIEMCRKIAEYGLTLVKPGDGILTHCNTGPLATSRYGTAIGPVFLGKERGIDFKVFADETRPLLQGARLTSYELEKAGVDVTLICDNMASIVMKKGWIQAVFFGCDRIAANGDVANKIGSSGVAILANYYGIPVYSFGPTSTIDIHCPSGEDIPIELRDPDEIKNMWYKEPMALPETKCFNPSFDVTDHSLLSGIVTDKGILYPPFTESIARLFEEKEDAE
ncbi:MAG: S-methyl-5-thioribose-1-phosphate isomerase [Erysipelotrichales bacterium]|nr:S-methyl-5-thioribose-1-phosphate isomerase [Erysipelotrichales bacterium]MBQ1386059.1 S-methyl-5-thioribose-1-phosphate isomerase [Erysipelotrichales bacterium]MBQ2479085.1 S-methyl-5-thioribose-1-phosphate isomerase [Erysipelotrichales bacterium]